MISALKILGRFTLCIFIGSSLAAPAIAQGTLTLTLHKIPMPICSGHSQAAQFIRNGLSRKTQIAAPVPIIASIGFTRRPDGPLLRQPKKPKNVIDARQRTRNFVKNEPDPKAILPEPGSVKKANAYQ
jgi:hypothetical protein